MKTGIQLITAERKRQVVEERWSGEHDDKHRRKEMAKAAASYLAAHTDPDKSVRQQSQADFCHDWPWAAKWWKPSDDPVRNLVKAGALIAAEIDRLERKASRSNDPSSATRPAGRVDCNQSAMAGFAAAHG